MTTSIAPLAQHRDSDQRGSTPPLALPAPVAAGPARGIAMGAALSAPMWIGILYLLRLVTGAF